MSFRNADVWQVDMKFNQKRVFVPAIAILVLLAVIAVPSFLKARKKSQRNACLNNLRQLTCPMTCCVPMVKDLREGDPLDQKEVCQYIKGGTMPVCPAGGTYLVTWVVGASNPTCSVHGDLLWQTEGVRTLKELAEINHRKRQQLAAQQTNGAVTEESAPRAAP